MLEADWNIVVWSGILGKRRILINESVQKNFTSKIEGLEKLNYHQRLKKLRMYSMERRRERYLIINAWQQIENEKENILKLETGNSDDPEERTMGRRRCIKSPVIPTTLSGGYRTVIHNSTARLCHTGYKQ